MSLIFAIGDVHGRADLLQRALARIRRTSGGRIVMLGDYVDRGPDACSVIEVLMETERSGAALCLKGNHEALMTDAIRYGDDLSMARWLDVGGAHTLRSYGVRDTTAEELARIPTEHLAWLSTLPLMHRDAHRVYVHAGLAPNRALADQDDDDCLWIREAFFQADPVEFPVDHIVHGHTPRRRPDLLAHRTNLDTGAWMTGILSVGVFQEEKPGGPVEVWSVT